METIATIIYSMRAQGVEVVTCVSDEMLDQAQERYGITFPEELRRFYICGMPVGGNFPNWISESEDDIKRIRHKLDFPMMSMMGAVEDIEYWNPLWGDRPEELEAALELARGEMARLMENNPVIPLAGHSYLVTGQGAGDEKSHPVISVFGDDVIYQAESLVAFFRQRYTLDEKPEITQEMVAGAGGWADYIS